MTKKPDEERRLWHEVGRDGRLPGLSLPAESFLVAPDNPSKRRLTTTGGTERH